MVGSVRFKEQLFPQQIRLHAEFNRMGKDFCSISEISLQAAVFVILIKTLSDPILNILLLVIPAS